MLPLGKWAHFDETGQILMGLSGGKSKNGGVFFDKKGEILGANSLSQPATVRGVYFAAGKSFGRNANNDKPFETKGRFIYSLKEGEDNFYWECLKFTHESLSLWDVIGEPPISLINPSAISFYFFYPIFRDHLFRPALYRLNRQPKPKERG